MSSDALSFTPSSSGNPDPRLQRLLELWDRLDEEKGVTNTLGMTVLVHGVTYSGLLIAGRVWAKTMGDLLRNTGETDPTNQIASLSVFYDEIVASYEKAGAADESRDYLHLANVVVGLPNDGSATRLMLRIRTGDVSAWSVGTMGPIAQFATATSGPSAEQA